MPDIEYMVYKTEPYILAAANLQKLTKENACEVMMAVANHSEHDPQIIVLCRMLFTPKEGGEFRNPLVGAANYLGDTGDKNWPLSPIEIVDGVPFLISMGYRLNGQAEPARYYLKYCMMNCNWNTHAYSAKSEQERQKALEKLLASSKWKSPLEDPEKEFLRSQISVAQERSGIASQDNQ